MAAARAYVDRPIGDVTAAAGAACTAAQRWRLAEPDLLRVGMNAIFVAGPHVLRVSAPTVPAAASLELMAFLADAGLNVPAVIDENLEQGFLLLSDLGSRPYLDELNGDTVARLYGDALGALVAIQTCIPDQGALPSYDRTLLLNEMELFREWLATDYPDRSNRVIKLIKDMHDGRDYRSEFGLRQKGSGPYAAQVAMRFRLALKRLGLNECRERLRTELFRSPAATSGQLSLI